MALVKKIMDLISSLNQLSSEFTPALLPKADRVFFCLESLWFILFPDHRFSSKYFLKDAAKEKAYLVLRECRQELEKQVSLAFQAQKKSEMEVKTLVEDFFNTLPSVKKKLLDDAQAAHERDPAANSMDEIILCYPGFLAILTYRLAHELSLRKVPLIPRMMSEYAHSLTGCDIHPEAKIGEKFFIDHATGTVIGQTSVIGNGVTLFQGVTLGAMALNPPGIHKRHPTLEDDVTVYANASILGGETVIGKGSIIGSFCWIMSSIPKKSKIRMAKPHLIQSFSGKTKECIPNWEI
ncbi:MAG: serine acetyltransferase [Deltaproteobacteria bacterium]|nr:serine acetyltransferase [Deltaproteobacteria bacterium]